MFTLPSISSGLELWSVNRTLIYENSESEVFENIIFFVKYLVIDKMAYLEQTYKDSWILMIIIIENITMD